MITELKIKNFLFLAEELNFSRAAEKLFITQQALSKQIAALEQDIGGKLFLRNQNALQLTPLGEELSSFFSQSEQRYQEIRRKHLKLDDHKLRICYFEDMDIAQPLHYAFTQLKEHYPAITYELICLKTFRDINTAMSRYEIDVAITPDSSSFSDSAYRKLTLHKSTLFACYSPRLCKEAGKPALSDLRDVQFFMGLEKTDSRSVLEASCKACGFMPRYYTDSSLSPSVERVMIESGEGAGVGGTYSILNRDNLLVKVELDAAARIIALWRNDPDNMMPEMFSLYLREQMLEP